jgi:hypothetical protein
MIAMGRFPKIHPMTIAAVYALAMPLLVAIVASPEFRHLLASRESQTLADWAAALGTISAFGAAIWLGGQEARRHTRSEADRVFRHARMVRILSWLCSQCVGQAESNVATGAPAAFSPSNFDEILWGLDRVVLDEITDASMLLDFLTIRRNMTFAREAYSLIVDAKENNRPINSSLAAEFGRAVREIRRAEASIGLRLVGLGHELYRLAPL